MHVVFDPERSIDFEAFFKNQVARNDSVKGGSISLPYTGFRYQRGSGLGRLLKAAFRLVLPYVKPVAKSVAKSLRKEVFSTGGRIVADMARGSNMASTIKKRGREAVHNLLQKAADNTHGYGKRRSKKKKGAIVAKRTPKKRSRLSDSLGVLKISNLGPKPKRSKKR